MKLFKAIKSILKTKPEIPSGEPMKPRCPVEKVETILSIRERQDEEVRFWVELKAKGETVKSWSYNKHTGKIRVNFDSGGRADIPKRESKAIMGH